MQQGKHKISLHIIEVSGLPVVPDGYLLSASVGESQLETDAFIGKGLSCRIDTKLVWEASRPDISRLKSRNVPIKINCIRRAKRKENAKCVATLLYSIRNIPFGPPEKVQETTAHWYKMNKTSSGFVRGNIEILMAVAITKDASETPEDFSEEDDSSARKYLSERTAGNEWKGKIYQELVELEHWKRKQKHAFLYNLRQKEEVLLNHLAQQWSAKCTGESDKLAQNLRECVELKETLEEEHRTLKDLLTRGGKCKCQNGGSAADEGDTLKEIKQENKQLRKENEDLKEKLGRESSLKEEISALTKELRNVANALRECDRSKSHYKEELEKIHEILQDICSKRGETTRRTFDLRDLLQKEYREMIEERQEIEAVKQSLCF
ncbi:centrosomal protein of 120 kDa-like [Lutzomyia longipalpis]|uniref:centrosomal protein of 120 kDa-like n=1 Tax=Lutzomyia longipalpis TaxID=7200 RepID=UPI0024836ED5|nr:centrosomal protein of 120 kDa-like [Lutzomyia longipalpis]